MRIYKFVRTEDFQLCLGEFDVKEDCYVNNKGNDTVDAQTISLLHTYLRSSEDWVKVEISKVYSIIQLHGTRLATFTKGEWTTSENPACGFHGFTKKDAKYFSAYAEHFEEQLSKMRDVSNSYELPLLSLGDHARY